MQKAFLTVLTVLTLTCCLATTGASAQAGKINEKDLVGTWTLVSIQNTLPDGKKAEGFGAGDGMAVFDSNGKFVQALSRHDIPKVASNNRNTATPEEGKAIVQNSLILYGTYSFDSAGMLILHVDRSTRLLHFSATSLAIGAAAFTVSAALRRYLFPNGQPLWATIFTALALAPPGAVVVQQSLRLFAPQALPYVSLGELTAQVLTINLFIGTIA
jgi:hypothetical protein